MEHNATNGYSNFGSTGVQLSASKINIAQAILTNGAGSTVYFQFFATGTASVTLGTTVPNFVIAVPATTTEIMSPSLPLLYYNGLSMYATTAITGSTTAPDTHHVQIFVG